MPGGFNVHFSTITNVADEREWWSFHEGMAASVKWRVRAVRVVKSAALPNGVPIAKYGPYSPIYTTPTSGALHGRADRGRSAAISDVDSTAASPHPHQLMPGFAWKGTRLQVGRRAAGLWRVYVFSDKQCVNPVMVGSVIGQPRVGAARHRAAQARPGRSRTSPTPSTASTSAWASSRIVSYGADGSLLSPGGAAVAAAAAGGTGSSRLGVVGTGSATTTAADERRVHDAPGQRLARGPLLVDGRPGAGRDLPAPIRRKGIQDSDKVEYHDTALPQDVCAAGQVWPFGIQSAPLTTSVADAVHLGPRWPAA